MEVRLDRPVLRRRQRPHAIHRGGALEELSRLSKRVRWVERELNRIAIEDREVSVTAGNGFGRSPDSRSSWAQRLRSATSSAARSAIRSTSSSAMSRVSAVTGCC